MKPFELRLNFKLLFALLLFFSCLPGLVSILSWYVKQLFSLRVTGKNGRKQEYGRIWTIVFASLFSKTNGEVPDSNHALKNIWPTNLILYKMCSFHGQFQITKKDICCILFELSLDYRQMLKQQIEILGETFIRLLEPRPAETSESRCTWPRDS